KLTRDRNLADDLYQETALKAFKYQDKFEENTNMKGWLSTIMKNSFINHFRKNKHRNQAQDATGQVYLQNYSDVTSRNNGEINIYVAEIKKMIEALDEGMKKPFLMAYQGYKYDEIQELMNLPMGTIKSRIHKARNILKNQIRQTFEEIAV
ncbi:MAG: RNA polymerase sigma-70 factor (ECF subfamily), partial [Saprospiraceae bacterium]